MRIDIDDDVFAALGKLREDGDGGIDAVLKRLLGFPPTGAPEAVATVASAPAGGCVIKGVHFPEGTRFRMWRGYAVHHASVKDGRWTDERGCVRSGPTAAAIAIRGGRSGGWREWKCMRPSDVEWIPILALRGDLLPPSPRRCINRGVFFPNGTRFRMRYKGKTHLASVVDGWWTDEAGKTFTGPTGAADAVKGYRGGGWDSWECRRPLDADWIPIVDLRDDHVQLTRLRASPSPRASGARAREATPGGIGGRVLRA